MYVLVNRTRASNFAVAAPESMDWAASGKRLSQMFSSAGCDQSGSRVQQNHIAPGRFLSRKNFANDGCVGFGVAAGNVFELGTLDPELFRSDLIGAHVSVAHFGDAGRARDGDFIQAIQAVDYKSAMRAQHAESFGYLFQQIESIDSDHLRGSSCRIGERAEQVKDGSQPQLAAGRLHIFHGGVHGGSEQKHNTDFFKTGAQNRGGQTDLHAQGLHDVRRTTPGAEAAVAVLGHPHAGAGNDECRRGGDVEGAAGVAAGAAGVNQRVPSRSADVQRGVLVKGQRLGRGTHGLGEADDLFHRLTLHVESDQQGRNLSVRGAAGEHLRHDRTRFFAGEGFSFIGNALQGFSDHGTATRVASFGCPRGRAHPQTCNRKSARKIAARPAGLPYR